MRDPAREQATIDFYLYNSDLVADTINHFAKAVKDATRREKIVGVFYGYLLQLCGEQRQQNAGHLALGRVLASPDVDFLTSPTSYAFRQLGGEGTAHFMSLFDSVKLHGKLWFNENDVRTSVSGGQVGEWGRPANLDGDLIQQDKELALALVNGAAQWWFDVGGNRYNHPRLMGRIGELVKAATAAQTLDRSAVDEVALVVDERSLCYLRVGDPLGSWLLLGQLPALQRIGAPVGHYLVTDLPLLAGIGQAQAVRPAAQGLLLPDQLRAHRRRPPGGGRASNATAACWCSSARPACIANGQLDETAMRDFTGINLRLANEPTSLRVTLRDGHAITAGLAGSAYGVEQNTAPACYADDPEATVLGTLPDGRAGLVVKQHDGWTAIYSAAPAHAAAPAPPHRRTRAGPLLHRSGRRGLGYSRSRRRERASPGPRVITLPRPARVTDLYRGTRLGDNLRSFQAEFGERATRVFVLK